MQAARRGPRDRRRCATPGSSIRVGLSRTRADRDPSARPARARRDVRHRAACRARRRCSRSASSSARCGSPRIARRCCSRRARSSSARCARAAAGSPTRRSARYKLGAVIGRGAMGEVYEAHELARRRSRSSCCRRPRSAIRNHVLRFLRELRTAAGLDVAERRPRDRGRRAAGAVPRDGAARGRDARGASCAASAALRAAEVVELVRQIGAGITAAAAAGVVHRDLKPQNVFLHRGVWKILDFGVARAIDSRRHADRGPRRRHAVVHGARAGERAARSITCTDLYALAAIAYRALTGHPPFAGGEIAETLYRVVHTAPRRPTLLADVPAERRPRARDRPREGSAEAVRDRRRARRRARRRVLRHRCPRVSPTAVARSSTRTRGRAHRGPRPRVCGCCVEYRGGSCVVFADASSDPTPTLRPRRTRSRRYDADRRRDARHRDRSADRMVGHQQGCADDHRAHQVQRSRHRDRRDREAAQQRAAARVHEGRAHRKRRSQGGRAQRRQGRDRHRQDGRQRSRARCRPARGAERARSRDDHDVVHQGRPRSGVARAQRQVAAVRAALRSDDDARRRETAHQRHRRHSRRLCRDARQDRGRARRLVPPASRPARANPRVRRRQRVLQPRRPHDQRLSRAVGRHDQAVQERRRRRREGRRGSRTA